MNIKNMNFMRNLQIQPYFETSLHRQVNIFLRWRHEKTNNILISNKIFKGYIHQNQYQYIDIKKDSWAFLCLHVMICYINNPHKADHMYSSIYVVWLWTLKWFGIVKLRFSRITTSKPAIVTNIFYKPGLTTSFKVLASLAKLDAFQSLNLSLYSFIWFMFWFL